MGLNPPPVNDVKPPSVPPKPPANGRVFEQPKREKASKDSGELPLIGILAGFLFGSFFGGE